MNNEHSSPPSQRHREASRRWLWHITATSFGAIQPVTTIVLQRRPVFSPPLLRGSVSKETAIARIAPVPVSVVFREGAALAVDLDPDHLPAGEAWQYESTSESLATRLSYKRDERRVGRRQLEAVTDWFFESTKACAKPFAGSGERGPHTSKAKAASLLCANFQLRIPGSRRGRPLLAMSLTLYPPPPRCAALTKIDISSADPADRNRVEKLTFT